MQRSWREDADKLTFIVCTHSGELHHNASTGQAQTVSLSPGEQDAPQNMIGDVNLFLYDDEEDGDDEQDSTVQDHGRTTNGKIVPKTVIGELEIMIARPDQRGKGLAQETLRAFMSYIQASLADILAEYTGSESAVLKYLRVKIDKDNVKSLKLFERVGFVRTSAEPNYFGEVELRTKVVEGRLEGVESMVGLEGCGNVLAYAERVHPLV